MRWAKHFFPIILLCSVLLGGLTGYLVGPEVGRLKPFGDIFLKLILTTVFPLIFFSVSSAIARIGSFKKVGKIIFYTAGVFIFTGVVASIYTLIIVKIFPPAQGVYLKLTAPESKISTVSFPNIILVLIIISILVGMVGKSFLKFLQAGEVIFMRVFSIIMYYAPIGFFCYFAVLVSELGTQLMHSYMRVTIIYYVFGIIYFLVGFTFYAYLAGRLEGVKLFWKNVFLPMITSIATCSSAASIPANLVATKAMGVSPEIYETVVPLGAIIHKDGSVIGGVIKIAFLFGIFHLSFSGVSVLLTALGVSLLVGTVMGAIPSGGMLGEVLILSVYGFPTSALIAIAAISIIIDPLATMLNVTGNSVSSMMIRRLVDP